MSDNVLTLGTQVSGAVVPNNPADTYATADSYHVKGAPKYVADNTERNAITEQRLRTSMLVYTEDSGIYWKLKLGYSIPTIDSDWEPAFITPSSVVGSFYVNTESGDDGNSGTIGSPFLTVQHAVDEAAVLMYANTDAFEINITNDGVTSFTENVVIPENAKGYYKFIGKTADNPTDTVWLGGGSINACLTCSNPAVVIDTDAMRFNNTGTTGIKMEAGKLIVRFVYFNGCKIGIDAADNTLIHLPTEADGDTAMINDSSSVSIGIYGKKSTQVIVDQSLVVLNSDYGIVFVDGGRLITKDGEDLIFGGPAGGGSGGLYFWAGANAQLSANMAFDLDTAGGNNACVYAKDSFFWVVANLTCTMTNADYGFQFKGKSEIQQSVGGTYAYGTGVDLSLEHGCNLTAQDNFDVLVTNMEFANDPQTIYSNDHRYLAASAQDTGLMVEGKLLGQETILSAATPTVLFVPASQRNTKVDVLFVTNGDSVGHHYNIYHDDNGNTANSTTAIASNVFIAAGDTHPYRGLSIYNTSGRILVEDVEGLLLTFSAYGSVNRFSANINWKMLGQTRPGNTNPVAMFNPTNNSQTKITDIYITNRNAAAQTFRVGIDNAGSTLDINSARFWNYPIQKNETVHITEEPWMNDVSGTFIFRSSVANDLTCTVYGKEKLGNAN